MLMGLKNRMIYSWMVTNVHRFVDECGEVNCTAMTEAWDSECGSGGDTLDMNHPAWDIAVDVGAAHEKKQK